MNTRFWKFQYVCLVICFSLVCVYSRKDIDSCSKEWARLPGILEKISPLLFPDNDIQLTDFGALGDGETDCTDAFRKAIDKCSETGGGRIIVSPGRYLTGAIHLKSYMNLHLEKGATILFSRDPKQYLPLVFTRFEGVELIRLGPGFWRVFTRISG